MSRARGEERQQSGPRATHCSSVDLQPARLRGAGWLSHSVNGFLLFLPLLPPLFSFICVFTPVFLAVWIPGFQLTSQSQTAACFRSASTSRGLRNHRGSCGLKTGLHDSNMVGVQPNLLEHRECPHCPPTGSCWTHSAAGARRYH